MGKNYKLLFYFLLICELTVAQEKDTVKVNMLSEVNVSAFRSQQNNLETSQSILTIGSNTLKKKIFRSLPEFFDNNGFLWLQKTNHGGGSLFLRGLTGNQTLILVDGIRLNNSITRYGPNQYLNTVNPYMVSQMEVLSGGGSVQYGSDAIGGLVQIFTQNPNFDKKIEFNANAQYGSHNMEKTINSSLCLSNKNLGFIISGSLRDFGDLMGGKMTGKQSPTGYNEIAFDLKGVWKIRSKSSLTLNHQKVKQGHVPVYHKVLLEDFKINEMELQGRNLSYLKLENEEKSKWFNKQSLTFSYQYNPEHRIIQKNNSPLIRTEHDQIKTLGFSLNNVSKPLDWYSINSGYEVYQDKVNSNRVDEEKGNITYKRGLYPDNSLYLNQSIFNLHRVNVNTFSLNYGVRYNTVELRIPDEKLGINNLNYEALIYNLGILKIFKEKFSVYSNFNTSFRAPNIDDLGTLGIVDFRYEIPSESLKPEMARQLEIGLKYYSKNHSVQFAWYKNYLSNLITREKLIGQMIENYQVYAKMNTGKTQITGFEFTSTSKISKVLEINTGLCYTIGQDLIKNEPLRRIPPFFGNLNLIYNYNNWHITPSIVAAGSQKRLAAGDIADNRIGPDGTEGYVIINLQYGINFGKLGFDIMANNLSNKDYKTHGSGVFQVGRSLWIKTSIIL